MALPTIQALEPFVRPSDGQIATAANWFTPAYHLMQALLGATAGGVDANSGNPSVCRTHQGGMLPYTNALGVTTNPGASPFTAYSSTTAVSILVPNGQQLVVTAIVADGTGAATGDVNVNTVTQSVNLWNLTTANGAIALPFPLVCDQNWILTLPQNVCATGYYVLRDSLVTPMAAVLDNNATVANRKTYTVPTGVTLWIYGCAVAVNGSVNVLEGLGGTQVLAYGAGGASTQGQGWTNGGHLGGMGAPVPVSAGTVLQGSDATNPVSIFGVLI